MEIDAEWRSQLRRRCFMALRNPVAHNHEHPLQMQEALEQLAALSVLARWIDSCEVDVAREQQELDRLTHR